MRSSMTGGEWTASRSQSAGAHLIGHAFAIIDYCCSAVVGPVVLGRRVSGVAAKGSGSIITSDRRVAQLKESLSLLLLRTCHALNV